MDAHRYVRIGVVGMLGILLSCGSAHERAEKILDNHGRAGSNANGINMVYISSTTVEGKQVCSVNVKGEYDPDNPNWAIANVRIFHRWDQIQWTSQDYEYQLEFSKGSPLSASSIDVPAKNSTRAYSIDFGEIFCIGGCGYDYDIQLSDGHGNWSSCLPSSKGNPMPGIGIIVKP